MSDDQRFGQALEHVVQIDGQALTREGIIALGVDSLALDVHDIIVLEQTLADAEVVLFDFSLRTLDRLRDHRVLDHLALFVTHLIHELGDAITLEQAHQLVLQTHIKLARTWITLTSGTSAQLAVDATRIVALGTDDGQAACCLNLITEFDVRTATSHVGCDGHFSWVTSLSDNFCLACVLLGVEHVVVDAAALQQARQHLRDVDRGRTHEYGSTLIGEPLDLINDRVVLLAISFEN